MARSQNRHPEEPKEQKPGSSLKSPVSLWFWSPFTTCMRCSEPILNFPRTHRGKLLQSTQNSALRIITGCTADTNTEPLHIETKTLLLSNHLKLHATQLRQNSQLPTHPLHNLLPQPADLRKKKETIFDNWSGTIITIKTIITMSLQQNS